MAHLLLSRFAEVQPKRFAAAERVVQAQDEALTAVLGGLPDFDWSAWLDATADITPGNRARLKQKFLRIAYGDSFRESILAALLAGQLIAEQQLKRQGLGTFSTKRQRNRPERFAEVPTLHTPEDAVRYWEKAIPLSPEQAAAMLADLQKYAPVAGKVIGEFTDDILKAVGDAFAYAEQEGLALPAFKEYAAELLQGKSKSLIETLFRTNLTQAYSDQALARIRRSGKRAPFIQYITVRDARVRPTHRAMHGFIAAADDAIWDLWTPPNGYNCRCILMPIMYLEAIRMGIYRVQDDGQVSYPKGKRPNGDPPKFVKVGKKLVPVVPDLVGGTKTLRLGGN